MSFICFDTEDNSKELLTQGKSGFLKRVTQIAALRRDGSSYYNRGDIASFKKYLGRIPERFIYAHNLQYDIGNLFGKEELDRLDCTFVGGRLIRAVWGNKIFLDTFNIWPMSARMLGKAFGLKKLRTASMAKDKAYVFRDVEIIWRAMNFAWQFTELMGLEVLPPTLGGLCVAIWLHWGGENVHDCLDLSRQALHGGRVELFKVHNEEDWIAYGDINSLYPAMMQKAYPGELSDWGKSLDAEFGIAECKVKQPETELAVLPYQDERGRILYPWGEFSGTWTLHELREFERRGGKVLGVKHCIGTNEAIYPYATFVDRLYKLRLETKSEAEKLFYKLLMNNLFGRLGASGKIGRTVWRTEKTERAGTPFGQKVLCYYHMPLTEETNWAHAAYISSYGRLELLKFMDLAGVDKMIYCDTDSVIFDCGNRKLPFPVGTALGQMKLESWERVCETFAPKTYRVGRKWKAKGVPRRLAREFILRGNASFDLPFKFREAIAFYDRGNIKQLSVWRKVSKQKVQSYDKKLLSGNRYFPLHVKQKEST